MPSIELDWAERSLRHVYLYYLKECFFNGVYFGLFAFSYAETTVLCYEPVITLPTDEFIHLYFQLKNAEFLTRENLKTSYG